MTHFWITVVPFVALFALLVPLRRPAYEAAPIAYLSTLVSALLVWQVSGDVVAASLLEALVVFVEVLLIVTLALLVLNVTIETGHMEAIKSLIGTLSIDQRVLAMLLGWALVGFIEGISGFGTPAVLASASARVFRNEAAQGSRSRVDRQQHGGAFRCRGNTGDHRACRPRS